uniref:Uncharacterized protein n=1 Tax=Anopheles quadriannulatus TaxID=34691 RepID=A0A182XQI8_ANOQN
MENKVPTKYPSVWLLLLAVKCAKY